MASIPDLAIFRIKGHKLRVKFRVRSPISQLHFLH
jgi:hypothetical protein